MNNQKNFIVGQVEKFQSIIPPSQNMFYQQFQNLDPETFIDQRKKIISPMHLVTWSPGNN